MRQKMLQLGSEIQKRAVDGERALDMGLSESARLLSALVEARMSLGLQACAERELIAEAGKLVTEQLVQRERALSIHGRLTTICAGMRIDPRSFGDGGPKDAPWIEEQNVQLKLVETERVAA